MHTKILTAFLLLAQSASAQLSVLKQGFRWDIEGDSRAITDHDLPIRTPDRRSISDPVFDAKKGVWHYTVESPYQKGENVVEVLLPDNFQGSEKYRVLYVLPVETGIGGKFGDGLQQVRAANAHNAHHFICVQMAFDATPYYDDHPTDPHIRQEQYLKRVVIPLIEDRYPTVAGREGRLLLGFSKSGWGAFTLILRDPDFFGYAVSWDAPLMFQADDFMTYEIPAIMGTKENFAQYLPSKLLAEHAEAFHDRTRLVLLGHTLFGPEPQKKFADHTAEMHALMDRLGVRHVYDNQLNVPHNWSSGWVKPAIEALARIVGPTPR